MSVNFSMHCGSKIKATDMSLWWFIFDFIQDLYKKLMASEVHPEDTSS